MKGVGRHKRIGLELAAIIGITCLFLFFIKSREKVEVHFSPGGSIQNLIVSKIDSAREKIDVAMFAFTSKEIAWALIRASNRGVKTRVILDGGFIENEFSKGGFLHTGGAEVRLHLNHIPGTEKSYGKMHHKFAIIDHKMVITGSYNWTASAEERNEENVVIFPCSPHLAHIYEKEFHKLWKEGTPYGDHLTKATSHDFPLLSAFNLRGLKENVKRIVRVYGIVHDVYHSEGSNTYFLHFGPQRSSFSAVIFSTAAEKFLQQRLDPHNYQGKKLELLGRVIDHPKYGLEMILEDPSQIKVIKEINNNKQYKDAA